jgi:hypothetical protein
MSTFPVLRTGAVIQFPATRTMQFATDVVQFIDGAEQRFRAYAQSYHRWVINCDALDETELNNIRNFVQGMNGAVGVFSFTDPWDSAVYQKCSIEGDVLVEMLAEPMQGRTSIVIRENKT